MKKVTMRVRVLGAVLAVVFALSAITALSVVGASAATISPHSDTGAPAHHISTDIRTQDGYDWWYPWNWQAPYHPVA